MFRMSNRGGSRGGFQRGGRGGGGYRGGGGGGGFRDRNAPPDSVTGKLIFYCFFLKFFLLTIIF